MFGKSDRARLERPWRSGEVGQRGSLQNCYAPVRSRPTPPIMDIRLRKVSLILAVLLLTAAGWSLSARHSSTKTLEDWKQTDAGMKHFAVTFSPSVDHIGSGWHESFTISGWSEFPESGWVVGFAPSVKSRGHILHHTNLINISRENPFCEGVYYPFFASGKELSSGFLPKGYGYRVEKGERIAYAGMFHHASKKVQHRKGIEIGRIEIFYLPDTGSKLRSVEPLFLDVVGACKYGEFAVSPGTTTLNSPDGLALPSAYRIIKAGAHMHDYGKQVTLLANNKSLFTAEATIDATGKLLSMPVIAPARKTLPAGTALTMQAEYFNTSGATTTEKGMAQFLLFLERL